VVATHELDIRAAIPVEEIVSSSNQTLAALRAVFTHWNCAAAIVRADGKVVLKTAAWDHSDLADVDSVQLVIASRPESNHTGSNGHSLNTEVCLREALRQPQETWMIDTSRELLSIVPMPINDSDDHFLVTVQHQTKEEVVAGRLNVALDSMRGGLWDWVCDGDDYRIYRSARICEILGISGYVANGTRDEWVDRIHPDDRADVEAKVAANFKGETPIYIADYRIKAANGEWIFIHDHGRVIERFPDGSPRRWVGICADVSDMVELQQTNQSYKAQLELALNSFQLEIWEYDADRRRVYLSPQMARRFGFAESPCHKSADELTGFIEPADMESVQLAFGEFRNGKETFDTEARIGPPGKRRWCRISASRNTIQDDGALRVAGALQDIHDRKRYELSLIEGESQFRRMADAAPVYIWLGDAKTGQCTFINKHWVAATGCAISHQLGDGWRDLVFTPDRSALDAAIDTVVQSGQPADVDFRLLNASGSYAYTVGRVSARLDLDGETIGLMMIVADATDLQLAEARLSLALDAAEAGLWDWRVQDDVVYTIPRTHLMLGEPVPDGPVNYEWFTSRVHPEDAQRIAQEIQKAHDDPAFEYRVRFRLRHYDGSYGWIGSTGRVIERDIDGRPLRMIGLHIDINELKETELQLSQAIDDLTITRSRLEDMLDHAPASVAMLDRDMCYLVASRRWKEDYDLIDQSIIGRCHYDVFPEIGAEWKAIHQECLGGAVRRCEDDRFVRFDGTVQYLRWEVRPWHDRVTGEIGGIAMYTEDITERKRAQALVHDAYAQESAIFGASRDPLLMVGASGRIKKASDTVEQVFGYSQSDLVGTPVVSLFADLAEHLKSHPDGSLDETHLLSIAGRPFEVTILHGSGQRVAGEVNISPVQMPDSDSIQFVASVRDVSDRKRIESEREQQIADMSHLSRLAVVDLMGIELAHEFRQPLGAIRNYVHSARMTCAKHPDSNSDLGIFLDEIESAVGHMTGLIESIRKFGKKPDMEHHDIAVEDIVDGALNLTATRIRTMGFRPERELATGRYRVRGDIVQLQQILVNLILNAADALENVEPSEREIRISAELAANNTVKLTVRDSGPGIDAAIAENLFEPFQSTHPSNLGMGLSISKQLAEAHGGQLMLECGSPTTFALHVPAVKGGDNHGH